MEASKRELERKKQEYLRRRGTVEQQKRQSAQRQEKQKLQQQDASPSDDAGTPFSISDSDKINHNVNTIAVQDTDEVSFFEDFVAGGFAGSASVIVGHPFDTIKVRMQTSSGSTSLFSNATSYGGIASLYRGMAPPLSAAAVVNAIIFSSYGASSRIYDQYLEQTDLSESHLLHDSTLKAFTCGSFAGLIQTVIICPMEHIKCRLQIQHGKGSPGRQFKGPVQAVRSILGTHGVRGLYRGWWITMLREVPAFGMYFSFYDFCKDRINDVLAKQSAKTYAQSSLSDDPTTRDAFFLPQHSHAWFASAMAGGLTGALTWGIIYPVDIVKTRIQTTPLDSSPKDLQMISIARSIVTTHGWKHLFRGLNVTLIRAFPVNGIIFPVYEFCLMQLANLEY